MRIRLNDPSLLPDLVNFLDRAGLTVSAETADTIGITVFRPLNEPTDDAADRLQIVGRLREWCALHRGAKVDILQGPDRVGLL